MKTYVKGFTAYITEEDRDAENRSFDWDRVKKKVLENFDTWRNEVKPHILDLNFKYTTRGMGPGSGDLIESPRYCNLQVIYELGKKSQYLI